MRKCLLLGGLGYIGLNLQKRLAGDYSLRILTLQSEASSVPGAEIVHGDFCTLESFEPLLEGVSLVLHLISTTVPIEGTAGVEAEVRSNVLPTLKLLEALRQRKEIQLVFFSSGGTVYGESTYGRRKESDGRFPISTYGMQKLVIEEFLEFYHRVHGLDYRCLRIANPYGTGQKDTRTQGLIPIFIRNILQGKPIQIWGDGETVRDFIHMDDLLSAFEAVLAYHGPERVFNIGSGIGHSITDIVSILSKELEVSDVQISYLPARSCDVSSSVLDPSRIMRETGWTPSHDIYSGVRDIIQRLKN